MAGRGKCQWEYKNEDENCKKDAVENYMLCDIHLKEQQKIIEVSERNSHLFATAGKITEDGAPTVIERITEDGEKEGNFDQLSVINEELFPNKRFLRARNNPRSIARHSFQGYKVLKVGQGSNRPIAGQGSVVREGFEDQVNEKGEIVIGDLIFMEIDKDKRDAIRAKNRNSSKERVDRILTGTGESKRMNSRSGLPNGIKYIAQQGKIDEDVVLTPPPSTRKTFVISDNPLAK